MLLALSTENNIYDSFRQSFNILIIIIIQKIIKKGSCYLKTKKRVLAYLLTLTLAMTSLPTQLFAQDTINTPVPISALVDTQTTTPGAIQINPNKYVGDGYEVEFKVVNKWPGAFQGEFVLTNTSDQPLENWTLKFDFEHEITNMWNAQIVTHEANSYIIKNMGHNQDIAPGSSVNIGFQANWNDEIKVPQSYDLLIAKQEVGDTDYTIDFKVTGDWGQAFNGEISITNNTEETIEDWTLEFDFDRNIERLWTAEIVEHDVNHYVIKNAGYNANIAPGQTITLGFSGNPGNVDSEPTNYVLNQLGQEIDYEKDTDGDGLPDWFEKELGTNPNKVDTDGDGLPDGYECFNLEIDPLKPDTDNNGVWDGDEDYDNDELTNLDEFIIGTDPLSEYTDFDTLNDGDEVNIYGTDPLKTDTDFDGLDDGDEILLGFDPLNPDSNGNGILDGNEKSFQTYEQTIYQEEKPEVTNVSVAFEGSGNLQKTTRISNIYNIDIQSSNVVGLVGVPVEINTSSKFDKATITFTYDESLLNNIPEEDLCIMWYDEANEWYQILDQDSIVDTVNNTVSVQTTHFSTYLLVNRKDWYDAWSKNLDYRKPVHSSMPTTYYDIALVLDASGSMSGTPIANAKYAARSFVDAMYIDDRIGIITFDSSAKTIADMTYAKDNTKKQEIKDLINNNVSASGGTATNTGLNKALQMLEDNTTLNKKVIVLLCDGDVQDPSTVISKAKQQNIKIYTVNFGSSGTTLLTKMAQDTGGKYYYAKTVEQLTKAFYDIERETYAEIDDTDTDGDKLPDVFEIIGMQLTNGTMVTSDPNKAYSDTDSWSDYQEIGDYITDKKVYLGNNNYAYKIHFRGKCDPRKDDTDGDGIIDSKDGRPLRYDISTAFIYRSNRDMGKNPDGTVANDLMVADYSKEDLLKLHPYFEYQVNEARDPEILFKEFSDMSTTLFAKGEMEDVILEMIEHFKDGTGSPYSNDILTKYASEHDSTKKYIELVKELVIDELAKNDGNLNSLKFDENSPASSIIYKYIQKHATNPKFNTLSDIQGGLTICVNDTWGNQIGIREYSFDGKYYSGIIHLCIYDQFGLDEPDVLPRSWWKNYGDLAGFRAWFTLQHYDRFNGKYRPFITKMEMDIPFKGQITILEQG